jgi:phospholipase C
VAAIGHTFIPHTHTKDPANHEYDINDFFVALKAHNLPAVSFLKAAAFEDGHAGYSDPLDEQHFIVRVINALQNSNEWSETAVIVLYDDSDGWYDHQMPPVVNASFNPTVDTLNGPGVCNTSNGFQQGRCQRRFSKATLANPRGAVAGMALVCHSWSYHPLPRGTSSTTR